MNENITKNVFLEEIQSVFENVLKECFENFKGIHFLNTFSEPYETFYYDLQDFIIDNNFTENLDNLTLILIYCSFILNPSNSLMYFEAKKRLMVELNKIQFGSFVEQIVLQYLANNENRNCNNDVMPSIIY